MSLVSILEKIDEKTEEKVKLEEEIAALEEEASFLRQKSPYPDLELFFEPKASQGKVIAIVFPPNRDRKLFDYLYDHCIATSHPPYESMSINISSRYYREEIRRAFAVYDIKLE